jgi:hypothetical protein
MYELYAFTAGRFVWRTERSAGVSPRFPACGRGAIVEGQLRIASWSGGRHSASMYVGDVIGWQTHDPHASIHWAAPSRKVKRARWKIHGEGVSDVDTAYQSPPVRMHRVVAGDTLAKLAEKYYGDAQLWPILYAVNREIIGSNPNQLRAGDPLRIPDLDELSPSERDRALNSVPKGTANTISMPPLR